MAALWSTQGDRAPVEVYGCAENLTGRPGRRVYTLSAGIVLRHVGWSARADRPSYRREPELWSLWSLDHQSSTVCVCDWSFGIFNESCQIQLLSTMEAIPCIVTLSLVFWQKTCLTQTGVCRGHGQIIWSSSSYSFINAKVDKTQLMYIYAYNQILQFRLLLTT